MRTPTHAAFGLGFTIATGTVLGVMLTPAVAVTALFGALLPDIDTPTSPIGRMCLPLARWLERRVGHRTLTHSLLGLGLAGLPALPLTWIDGHWTLAFLLGYLSHLLVDAANPPGVPLFYPSPVRAVFPGRLALRPAEGSQGEAVLCAGFLLGLAVLWPLHLVGFTRALHLLTRTTGGAIADFRRWEGTREVWADLDGLFRLSQRRVHQRVQVLGVANTSTLIVLDPATGTVHTVGPAESGNVFPQAIVAHPGQPVRVETRPVTLTQQLLRDLLREVPSDGETYLHGIVRTPDAPALKPDPEAYETLKAGLGALELRFARPRDLEDPQLGSLFVLSGLVLVQTVRPATALPVPPHAAPPRAPEFDDVTELFIAHVTDPARELRVREGERVQQGQLLARLTWKDPELERQRQHARAELVERQVVEALRGAAVRQAQALIDAGLAAPGAAGRAEAELLAAQAAVAQARRELDRLADEARRAIEVRAPVAGQVLTLRIHVVHGSEGTARLRLLYRRPSRNSSTTDRPGPHGAGILQPDDPVRSESVSSRARRVTRPSLALLVLLAVGETMAAAGCRGRVVGVTDGDTLTIFCGGRPTAVRLHGVDAPERGQAFGAQAKQFVSALVFGKTVIVSRRGLDRYGRTMGDVTLPDGRDLAQELVRAGYGWWFRRYSADSRLATLQTQARAAHRGLWTDPHPVPPWDWRRTQKTREFGGGKTEVIHE